jgi:hypothetical protein
MLPSPGAAFTTAARRRAGLVSGVAVALAVALSVALAVGVAACGRTVHDSAPSPPPRPSAAAPSATSPSESRDVAFEACKARYDAVLARAPAPGAPAFDARRPEFLGRARGEPVVFVDAPKAAPRDGLSKLATNLALAFDKERPGLRVVLLRDRSKLDKAALRTLLLKQGYLYFDDPNDLFFAVEKVSLADLFDAPELYLLRKSDVFKLVRGGTARDPAYVFADGPDAGRAVPLLFGDRVAETAKELEAPLHRDVASLADREGFDRLRIDRLTTTDIAATLSYGELSARAVVTSEGAKLSLACVAEPKERRDAVAAWLASTATRRAALANLRRAVSEGVADTLPFDHPRGFEGPDRDGELRAHWLGAYLRGQQTFTDDDQTYLVFRADGRPATPEVCVDFVLDSFERAGGSWYAPRGETPGRSPGRLSFDDYKPENRRGVIGFGQFAERHPELFEFRRFTGDERTPFARRAKFFAFLADHADLFAPGDILSIQGEKADGRIHQHAILLERTDPLTGFPSGLADHMHLPRRRSWEGIMAEAPKRALLYRARPKESLFDKIAPPDATLASTH